MMVATGGIPPLPNFYVGSWDGVASSPSNTTDFQFTRFPILARGAF